MSLRLYRADKYYLLDFQNLATNDDNPNAFWLPHEPTQSSSSSSSSSESDLNGAHTMEFFELCATVISVCFP